MLTQIQVSHIVLIQKFM